MTESVLRQLTMLRLIPRNPRRIGTMELQARLAERHLPTSLRTVQRDLKTLSTVFPITADDARPAGWWWMGEDAVHDLPGMDLPTALTFALTDRFLEPLLPRATLQYLQPHFRRAGEILKELQDTGVGRWPDKVRMVSRNQSLLAPEVRADVLDAVYEALLEGRRIAAKYTRRGERRAQACEVSPLGLVYRDGVVYLVGTLWDYDDVVQLLLHRMKDAELLDKPARTARGFDLDAYIADGNFGFRNSQQSIRLKAEFRDSAGFHLLETPLSADQKLTEDEEGRVRVEATVLDTEQLRWWLLGFGDKVEVLAPGKLRREFAEKSRQMARTYDSPANAGGKRKTRKHDSLTGSKQSTRVA